MQLMST